MIVTLTPNPSVDLTHHVPALHRGSVVRVEDSRVDAGGKGVNVSRALAASGRHSRAVLPVGGADGERLVGLLHGIERLDVHAVPVTGTTRTNISLVEPDGTVTKVNAPGPQLGSAEVEALRAGVLAAADAEGARWAVLSGSLPPGAPVDLYATLTADLHARGVRVAVDASGEPLRRALAARPDVVKPNSHELGEVLGRGIATRGQLVAGARELLGLGPVAVLASAGADGAVLVTAEHTWHGASHVAVPRSAVGAGDAMLAGFLAARTAGADADATPTATDGPLGASGPDALVEALAWGAAATSLPGSRMPAPHDIDRGRVQLDATPDLDHRLQEGAPA